MFLIKAILGLSGAVAGAVVPVVTNKLSEASAQAVSSVSNLNVVKASQKQLLESHQIRKLGEALKVLQDKKCKLVVNPKNLNNSFGALHVCPEGSGTVFYYLDSLESLGQDFPSNQPKKVISVNYKEISDKKEAYLELSLEGSKKVDLAIEEQGPGGWAHFKDVKVSDQCRLVTPESGSDLLRCELKNPSDSSTFSYAFSVFR